MRFSAKVPGGKLLPALPDAWKSGEVKGLKARGGIEVDISWKNNKVINARFKGIPNTKGQFVVDNKSLTYQLIKNGIFRY